MEKTTLQRVIKCCAWSPKWNKVIFDGKDGITINVHAKTAWKDTVCDDCIQLMQYVGQPDAEGNDVYEGFILQSTVDSGLLNWLVLFKDGCFGIKNIGVDGHTNHAEFHPIKSAYYFEDRRIIGNIYTHPDLVVDCTE